MLNRVSHTILMIMLCWGGIVVHAADIDPQRPAESLYRIYAEAEQTGWTSLQHIQAGNMAYQINDKARAVAHWQASMTQDMTVLRRLTETLIEFNQWENAIDTLRLWLMINPSDDYPNHQLGLLLSARDPLQAIVHLQATNPQTRETEHTTAIMNHLEQSAQSPALPLLIGQVLFDQGRFAYAEYAFKYGAMWAVDSSPIAWAYIALARQVQGKQSAEWMELALQQGGNDPEIHHVHGLYLRGEGLYTESRDAFARATTFDLENPRYYFELSQAYQYMGDMTTAHYWLEYAVLVSGHDPMYVERLNQFYWEEQDLLRRITGQ